MDSYRKNLRGLQVGVKQRMKFQYKRGEREISYRATEG